MLVVYRYLWFKCAHKISRIRFVVFLPAVLVSALECRRALLLVCKLDGSNVCAPCPFTANPLRILIIDHVFKSVAEQVYYSSPPSRQRHWQGGGTCMVFEVENNGNINTAQRSLSGPPEFRFPNALVYVASWQISIKVACTLMNSVFPKQWFFTRSRHPIIKVIPEDTKDLLSLFFLFCMYSP